MSDQEEGYEPTGEHESWTPQAGAGGWGLPPNEPAAWGSTWQVPTQQVPTQQYPGGWGMPAGPMWGPPPVPVPPAGASSRRRVSAAMTAFLMVVAALAGVGVGHVAWQSAAGRQNAAAPPARHSPSPLPGGSSNPRGGGNGNASPFAPNNNNNGGGGAPALGSGAPADTKAIAGKVDPALVDINSNFDYPEPAAGAGTGIVVSSRGEIITNNHVIEDATRISVTDVGNHQTYAATVVGYDATHDIAILQLSGASNLTTAKLGNSSKLSIRQPVVAIGNAGGLGGTPTSTGGSIFGLNQSITAADELDGGSEQLSGLIAVTADVQPGDSGGSLVNASGQVIGMDTAASASFSFQQSQGGDGYAIPINRVMRTASAVESGHQTATIHVGPTAFLGVITVAVGQSSGSVGSPTSGAEVKEVIPGEASDRIGLAAGDVITSFDGHKVASPTSLGKLIEPLHPGNKVPIDWVDPQGRSHSAIVQLGTGPAA